ncbi:hypothetical protein NE237_029007 [Protea cynaroides]|uniref:G-patch domain-containing protein n=1 Tax=Protea cynaroides TaxID=273540 RepID=A0A9Q0JVP3_9MAGN|nr:hypothetical protein NE237_029007 [Protea cynaroides]
MKEKHFTAFVYSCSNKMHGIPIELLSELTATRLLSEKFNADTKGSPISGRALEKARIILSADQDVQAAAHPVTSAIPDDVQATEVRRSQAINPNQYRRHGETSSQALACRGRNRKEIVILNWREEVRKHEILSLFLIQSVIEPSQHKPAANFEWDDSKDDGEIKHEYVTEFDASENLNHSENLVIPPKSNEWRPQEKMSNLDLPVRSSADYPDIGFEVDAPSTAGISDSGMSYGLNLRHAKEVTVIRDDKDKMEVDRPSRSGPVEDLTLQRFKEDIKNLPDDQGFDEFVNVPVEGFGAALLAGYGWHEGKGIGRNSKEDVKVVEFTRRTWMAGLGFVADMPDAKKHRQEQIVEYVGDPSYLGYRFS